MYWGEGSKSEFNLINSDPLLIKLVYGFMIATGVEKSRIHFSLRLHDDLDEKKSIKFWCDLLDIPPSKITYVALIKGDKKGKLKYGMCRIRMEKSGDYFKYVMSVIDLIKQNAAVVQWIERGVPNS